MWWLFLFPQLNEHKTLTREHYKIFGLSWAGWVFDFYDLMLFTYLTAELQADLGLTPTMLSLCIGISLLATAVGGIVFGALGDKYGRKKVLQWTIIIYSVGAFLGVDQGTDCTPLDTDAYVVKSGGVQDSFSCLNGVERESLKTTIQFSSFPPFASPCCLKNSTSSNRAKVLEGAMNFSNLSGV